MYVNENSWNIIALWEDIGNRNDFNNFSVFRNVQLILQASFVSFSFYNCFIYHKYHIHKRPKVIFFSCKLLADL